METQKASVFVTAITAEQLTRVSYSLAVKYNTKLEVFDREKHVSFLRRCVRYQCRKFYRTDLWTGNPTKAAPKNILRKILRKNNLFIEASHSSRAFFKLCRQFIYFNSSFSSAKVEFKNNLKNFLRSFRVLLWDWSH
jgi:hypothetical protein